MFHLCDGLESFALMRNTMTRKLLAASAVGVFAVGAAACSSDDTEDPGDDPTEEIDDGIDDGVEEVDDGVEEIDDGVEEVDDGVDE